MLALRNNQKKIQQINEKLYYAAIDYYGEKYQSEIDQTIQTTMIYDMKKDSLKKAIQLILGDKVSIKLPCMHNISSFFLVNTFSHYEKYVLCRGNESRISIENALAHELYGHALFGVKNFLVNNKTGIYLRNGFCLKSFVGDDQIYPMWTEGCAALVQEELLTRLDHPFYLAPSYQVAYQGAKFLKEVVGKEKLNESLIDGSKEAILEFNEKLAPILSSAFQAIEQLSTLHAEASLGKSHVPSGYIEQIDKIVKQYRMTR